MAGEESTKEGLLSDRVDLVNSLEFAKQLLVTLRNIADYVEDLGVSNRQLVKVLTKLLPAGPDE